MGYTPQVKWIGVLAPITGQNPLASQTYYIGTAPTTLSTSQDVRGRLYVPEDCLLTRVKLFIMTTAGSNENVAFYIRINQTTDLTISTTVDMSVTRTVIDKTFNQPLSAGDYINLKMVCPNWVSAPTTTYVYCQCEFAYG